MYINIKPVEQCDLEHDCKPVVQDCAEGCGCFFDAIHEAPSQASTEVASNQTSTVDTKQFTLNANDEDLVTLETLEVTHADGTSNRSSLQRKLYQIQENEEDTNHHFGLFCGLNNTQTDAQKDDKSRFGMESQWGLKPTDSEDTSAVQKGRCSTACN